MGRRFLTLLLAFAAMVVGIEGLRRAVDWWNAVPVLGGDTAGAVPPAPTFIDYVLIASLPLIAWLWWRFASPFGKGRGQCLDGTCQRDEGSGTIQERRRRKAAKPARPSPSKASDPGSDT